MSRDRYGTLRCMVSTILSMQSRLYIWWVYLKSFFYSLRAFFSTKQHGDRYVYR